MKRRAILLISILFFGSLAAQEIPRTDIDTVGIRIYFECGGSTLDQAFNGNGQRIDAFSKKVSELNQDSLRCVKSVRVVTAASPEGNSLINKELTQRRANSIISFLRRQEGLSGVELEIDARGVDWDGLRAAVEASDIACRQEILDIIDNTPELTPKNGVIVDSRKGKLISLRNGSIWREMNSRFFSDLRYSQVNIVYTKEYLDKIDSLANAAAQAALTPAPVEESSSASDSVTEPAEAVATTDNTSGGDIASATSSDDTSLRKPFYIALKTNMLYDVGLIPNIGAEFYLGRGWSIGGNWQYSWWKTDRHHYYWRTYGGELELRKYIGRQARIKPLSGHHLSLYGHILTYDFELGGRGNLSKFSYGGGIEYGYSLPVSRRLNIDFGIGIGYFGGIYKKYDPIDTHYVWQQTVRRHWIGPTKAEISLVWLIGRGNWNEKQGKGGTR